jgi:hypothetical protein
MLHRSKNNRPGTKLTGRNQHLFHEELIGRDGTLIAGSRFAMMTLTMVSLLVGMVLGQRFKVLVLMPTIAMALVLAIGAGVARADAVWWIVLMAAATATSLQIGYLIGIGIRHILVATRASRSPATSLTGSASTGRPAH